jgi:hypothetical protein
MLYVIKFDNGLYWTGYNKASEQIRKARIYNSIKYAEEAGFDCMARRKAIWPQPTMSEVVGFRVVEVELIEKGEIE